jgi:ABC-2 type transport system permease protein
MWKDLDEVLRNRYIVSSMATFPLIFSVAIPLIYLLTIPPEISMADLAMLGSLVSGFDAMTPRQAIVYFLVQSNLPFYLLMPAVMPTLIASYSIAGEKKAGTLEPLLATPARASDILFGKTLAAVVPSVIITWASFAIYATLVNYMTAGLFPAPLLPDALWAIALLVTAPLVSVLAVYASLLVSSRMTDVRAAQQVSAVLIVPIMGFFVLQLFGMVSLSATFLAAVSLALLLIDALLVKAGAAVFRREEILTRWG